LQAGYNSYNLFYIVYNNFGQVTLSSLKRSSRIWSRIQSFLVARPGTSKGKTKVAWARVCLPKREGGLGLQRVASWNRVAIMKHIWNLFINAGSLWVAWIHANLLKGKCFWTVKIPQESTWGWREILKLRDEARKFIRFEVGDGETILPLASYWVFGSKIWLLCHL